MIRLGRKRDNSGNSVTKTNTRILIPKKGSPALLTFPIEVLPMLDATNKHTPTGGVVRPMIKFRTAITVKCIGSTSTSIATFSKIGNKINKAAIVSMKVPTNISKRLINKSTAYLFVVQRSICSEIPCGICSVMSMNPNKLAKPTNIMSDAVVFMESKMTTEMFLRFSFYRQMFQ